MCDGGPKDNGSSLCGSVSEVNNVSVTISAEYPDCANDFSTNSQQCYPSTLGSMVMLLSWSTPTGSSDHQSHPQVLPSFPIIFDWKLDGSLWLCVWGFNNLNIKNRFASRVGRVHLGRPWPEPSQYETFKSSLDLPNFTGGLSKFSRIAVLLTSILKTSGSTESTTRPGKGDLGVAGNGGDDGATTSMFRMSSSTDSSAS